MIASIQMCRELAKRRSRMPYQDLQWSVCTCPSATNKEIIDQCSSIPALDTAGVWTSKGVRSTERVLHLENLIRTAHNSEVVIIINVMCGNRKS